MRARTPTRTSQTRFSPARSVGPYTLSFSLSTPDTFSEKSDLRVTINLPTWHQRSGTHHQLSESLNIEMQPAMWEDNEMRRNPRVYTKEIETKSKLPHTPRRKIERFKLKRTATEQQVSETPEAFRTRQRWSRTNTYNWCVPVDNHTEKISSRGLNAKRENHVLGGKLSRSVKMSLAVFNHKQLRCFFETSTLMLWTQEQEHSTAPLTTVS